MNVAASPASSATKSSQTGSPDSKPTTKRALGVWYAAQSVFVRVGVLVVVAVVLALLAYPIGRMVVQAFTASGTWDFSAFGKVANQEWFWPTMRYTLIVVGSAAIIALIVASVLAWINERTDAGLGWLGTIMPLIPMFMPPIAAAAGWFFLASPDVGFLNVWLDPLVGSRRTLNVLTIPGLIFVYVLELVPYAYIPIAGALRNVDPALEEAARVSGAGVFKTFFTVSLPAVRQALVSALFLLIAVGFAIYSAPVVIGTNANINVLSVQVVRLIQFTFPADLQSATVLTTILLAFVLSAWVLQQVVTGRGRHAMISGRSGQSKSRLGGWRWPLRILTLLYIVVTTVLPFVALIIVSLQPFWSPHVDPTEFGTQNFIQLFGRSQNATALRTSLTLGIVGGLIAVIIAVFIALAKRPTSYGNLLPRWLSAAVDAILRLPAAFSHIVIGLGFIVAFSGPPFNLNGTPMILGLCYIVAYMPQATTTTGNALSQIGNDLTEASFVSRAGELRTNARIVIPLATPGLLSSWALLFVLFSTEISASTMLAGAKTPVVGFVLVDIWNNGTVGPMAAFALIVTLITSATVVLMLLLGRQRFRRAR